MEYDFELSVWRSGEGQDGFARRPQVLAFVPEAPSDSLVLRATS